MQTRELGQNKGLLESARLLSEQPTKNPQKAIQITKAGRLIYAERDGKIYQFVADRLQRHLNIDIYDNFHIANKQRQAMAVELFFKELAETHSYTFPEENRPETLKMEDVVSHLRRAGLTSPKKKAEAPFSWLRTTPAEANELLAKYTDIKNFQNLQRPQRRALKSVIDAWKTSLDKTHFPVEAEAALIDMIRSSKPLLEAVKDNPPLAGEYRSKCAQLGHRTANFFITSTGNKNYEGTVSSALDLMHAHSEFAKWLTSHEALPEPAPDQPVFAPCTLAPSLYAAVALKGNKDVQACLAAGNGVELQTLLAATEEFAEDYKKGGGSAAELIAEHNIREPLFAMCTSLEPIRTCLAASGIGKAAVFSKSEAINVINHDDAMSTWALEANNLVSALGERQEHAQKQGAQNFYSAENISKDMHARNSFEHCTGQRWDELDNDQKQCAARLCQQFAQSALFAGEHVESRLTRMSGLIAQLTANPHLANKFDRTITDAQNHLALIIPDCIADEKSGQQKLAETYMRLVSMPLIQLCQEMGPQSNLKDLTTLVANLTLSGLQPEQIGKLGAAALSEDANIASLLKIAQVTRSYSSQQFIPTPEMLGVDKAYHEEAFHMNMLRSLANEAIRHSPASATGGISAAGRDSQDKDWLQSKPQTSQYEEHAPVKHAKPTALTKQAAELNEVITHTLMETLHA